MRKFTLRYVTYLSNRQPYVTLDNAKNDFCLLHTCKFVTFILRVQHNVLVFQEIKCTRGTT